jgi:hypothetical protein
MFPQSGHKMVEGSDAHHKPLNAFDTPDLAYFSNGRDLVRICFNATLGEDVPQKFAPGTPKVHFSRFSPILECLRLVKVSSRLRMRLLPYQAITMMSMM